MSLTPPLSLNETAFYITRAAVGAGAPWGAAEGLARWAKTMARAGEDPAPYIAEALTQLDKNPNSARMVLTGEGADAVLAAEDGGALSSICAAPAVRDWMIEHANTDGARLSVLNPDVERITDDAAQISPAAQPVQTGGVQLDAAAWEVIQTFFKRCLAPATEASRLSGAGAGVNDTD